MIVRAAEPEEYVEISDMVLKAFKKSEIEHTIIKVTTNEDTNFQTGDLRVVEDDGKIVSMMMLIRRPLRIGTAVVNGAIIAPVATHPEYERKGYCSAVMKDAIQYMKEQGFDISILWGHPWLYTHYGYSPAMMKTELVLTSKQSSPTETISYRSSSFTENDLKKMTEIYHSNTSTRTCAEMRSPTMWEWKPGGSNVDLEVFTDEMGELIGYRALGTDWNDRPCAHEIGTLNYKACRVIFKSLVKTAKKKGLKEYYCVIHPDHPFSRFAFWHDGEIRINRGGGAGMARVLNLVSLFTKIGKEFEHRLAHSEFRNLECTMKISSDEEFTVLDINRGRVSATTNNIKCDCELAIPLEFLNPLITGFRGIKELVKNPNVKARGGKRVVRLIEVLFPTGYPFGAWLPLFWE